MVQQPQPKKAVEIIRQAFAAKGAKIQTKEAYELLAQLWGYKDWATYRGMNPKAGAEVVKQVVPFARQADELEGWETWVVCSRVNDDGEDALYVLPYGATFDNRLAPRRSWTLFNDDDAVELTVGFTDPNVPRESWQDLVVAVRVGCEHASSDSYGFPVYANDREVHQWLEQTLGWGYLADETGRSCVDVVSRDRGDDGADNWWVELRVAPQVHERLLTQWLPVNLAFNQVWPGLMVDAPYPWRQSDERFDPRCAALRSKACKVFADLNGMTLGAAMKALEWETDQDRHAETALREGLRDKHVTLDGAFERYTVGQLKAHLKKAIDEASQVPVSV